MRSNNWTVTTLVPLKGDNSPSPSRQLLLCGAIALYFGPCFSFSELWIKDLGREASLFCVERTTQTYQNHQLKNGRSRFSEWTVKVGRLFYRPTCILCSNPPDSQGQYHTWLKTPPFLDLLFPKVFVELDVSARYGRQAAEKASVFPCKPRSWLCLS